MDGGGRSERIGTESYLKSSFVRFLRIPSFRLINNKGRTRPFCTREVPSHNVKWSILRLWQRNLLNIAVNPTKPTAFPTRMDRYESEVWEGQLTLLETIPDGPDTRRVLSTMSATTLFKTAMRSDKLFILVGNYLDFIDQYGIDEEEESIGSPMETEEITQTDGEEPQPDMDSVTTHVSDSEPGEGANQGPASHVPLPLLPTELKLHLLKDLGLADRIHFAQTSANASHLSAAVLQTAAASMLRRFRLRFSEVRLMQTALGSLITGSGMISLIHAGPHFDPNDLDFVTRRGDSWDVVKFLEKAGSYEYKGLLPVYAHSEGVRRVRLLEHPLGLKVKVIESETSNPIDVVALSPSSSAIGAWGPNGIWHGYASITTRSISITTPVRMHICDDALHRRYIWAFLRKYTDRGFTFSLNDFDKYHECGSHFSCPATVRTSDDGGCVNVHFPRWEYTQDTEEEPITCWSLGGTGCAHGILYRPGGRVVAATNTQVYSWLRSLRRLIQAKEPPV
ncbi:hypothetical protein B0H13DRAFT_1951710 [Mycena leptocephala]|nr:hypothetical protein B0H13DRAFT_1951710 [Mycena leptocephala]